jgi:hypothetical protein
MMSSSVSADTDGIIIDAEAKSISFHGADGKDSFSPGTATRNNVRFAVGKVDNGNFGMRAYDASGNAVLSITDEPEALIAGWTIDTTSISKGNTTLTSATNGSYLGIGATGYAGGAGIFIGQTAATTYKISAEGTAGKMLWDNTKLEVQGADGTSVFVTTATGATIGGFTISDTQISDGSKLFLKSSGQISGSTFKFSDNLSGDVSAARYGTAAFDNYMYNDGSSFNIQTEAFNLNTANLVISSSNNGVIAMGSSPPTAYTNGTGFYVNGLGDLLIGNNTGSRIQYSQAEDTLIMSASSFMLGKGSTGAGGQFISGSPNSGGTIEISSSNFHLSKTGDVTMAGTVTAADGNIGGFYLGSNDIWGGNSAIGNAATTIVLGNLDGTSAIKMGASADAITAGANEGFYADGDGNFRAGVGTGDAGSYVAYTAGAALEISSSNMHIDADSITTRQMHAADFITADYLGYRNVTINWDVGAQKTMYVAKYTNTENYYALIMDGSRGGLMGGFIRHNNATTTYADLPIAMSINPGSQIGAFIHMEGGDTSPGAAGTNITSLGGLYFARSKGRSRSVLESASGGITDSGLNSNTNALATTTRNWTATSDQAFTSDPHDYAGTGTNGELGDAFWSHEATLSSVLYTAMARITTGVRYTFVKSNYSYRLSGATSYHQFAPNFYQGLNVGEGGSAKNAGLTIGMASLRNTTYPLYVNGDGYSTGTFVDGSDDRWKINKKDLKDALDMVLHLRGKVFNWNIAGYPDKAWSEEQQIGFIAQEVEKVIPEIVTRDSEGYYGISYGRLTPILTGAIQELAFENHNIKNEMKQMWKEIKKLSPQIHNDEWKYSKEDLEFKEFLERKGLEDNGNK